MTKATKILLGLMLAVCGVARAQLTAVVTPGYTFQPNEIPTTQKLNQAATPIIQILGTVGGSNGLAANSVNGTMLYSGVVDNLTLDFNGATPRQIEVKAAGVGKTQVATNVAGAGLSGGAGTALSVQVDTNNTLINTNNQVTLNPTNWGTVSNTLLGTTTTSGNTNLSRIVPVNLPLAVQDGVGLVLTNFTTAEQSMAILSSGGFSISVAHPFGVVPRQVRWVLVCKTADQGHSVGEELDIRAWTVRGSLTPEFQTSADANNLYLVAMNAAANGGLQFYNKSTFSIATPTPGSWKAKAYVWQ